MGLMSSALHIGRNALISYQNALQVVGGNISGAGTADYTRLLPQLDALPGNPIGSGLQPGAGVTLNGIQRTIDEALEGRLRLSIGDLAAADVERSTLSQVETFYDDVDGSGVSSRLQNFFNAFNNLQNTPEDIAVRDLVVQGGIQLAESLQTLRGRLVGLGEDLDGQVSLLVDAADELAAEIADLNQQITTAEAGGSGVATALRDQRDGRLRDLAELFDVTVREQSDGSVNVYVGSEALIQGARSRGLAVERSTDGQFTRTSVRFADTGGALAVRSGKLAGLIRTRENHVFSRVESVDELAAALITDVNRIHADGQGLVGYRELIGTQAVLSTTLPLNHPDVGLSGAVRTGSFVITVQDDATGTPLAYEIPIDLDGNGADTSLELLATEINNRAEGVSATITSDRRLSLTALDGYSFTIGQDGQSSRADTSGAPAALGINAFFKGTDAASISVNDALIEAPELIAAASAFLPGDGSNALRIASLAIDPSPTLGVPVTDYFLGQVSEVASVAGKANGNLEATQAVTSALSAQRESVSGVNLDEEAISLIKFQRAYQGAARFVSVVDGLVNELVSLIQ